jgi:hypothetical protein
MFNLLNDKIKHSLLREIQNGTNGENISNYNDIPNTEEEMECIITFEITLENCFYTLFFHFYNREFWALAAAHSFGNLECEICNKYIAPGYDFLPTLEKILKEEGLNENNISDELKRVEGLIDEFDDDDHWCFVLEENIDIVREVLFRRHKDDLLKIGITEKLWFI